MTLTRGTYNEIPIKESSEFRRIYLKTMIEMNGRNKDPQRKGHKNQLKADANEVGTFQCSGGAKHKSQRNETVSGPEHLNN